MTVNAILAHDASYGIGKNNGLPWDHSPADMLWFKNNTSSGVVVMGRKTWESIGCNKLPNRYNVVMSSSAVRGTPDLQYNGDVGVLIKKLQQEHPDRSIWFIGGAALYQQAFPYCKNIYTTEFSEVYGCDTFVDMETALIGFFPMAQKVQDGLTFTIWGRV